MDTWLSEATAKQPEFVSSEKRKSDNYKRLAKELSEEQNSHSRVFIIDSGASHHVVNRSVLTKSEPHTVKKRDQVVALKTEHGII
eukprot:10336916-Karenia_brevis.AAC.1